MAAIAAVMLASIVLTTTKLMRRSVPDSVEPGLKPNQPKARMNVPSTTIGMLWPGIACGLPLTYLPMRGPMTSAAGQADDAAHGMHDAGAGEVDGAVAEAPVHAGLGQPAAAPHPVGVDAVGQRDPQAVEAEVLPRPALGHGAGRESWRSCP